MRPTTPRPARARRWPSPGSRRRRRAPVERRVVYPPFAALAKAGSALGHNFFVLDPDGPLRHTVPFAQTGTHVLPSLGLAAALEAAGIAPRDVRFDGDRLVIGDRVMPLSWRQVKSSDGVERYQWGLINFRGPALLADLKQRTYPTYSFFDLAAAEQEILNDRKPAIDPAIFRDQDRLRRHDGVGPLRRLRDAVLERADARDQHPRRGGGRRAVRAASSATRARASAIATVTAAAVAIGLRGHGHCRRGGRPRRRPSSSRR